MKTHYLTYLGGLAALTLAVMVIRAPLDLDLATDALALDDSAAATYLFKCNSNSTAPTVTASVPSLSVVVTPTVATVAAAPTYNIVSATLSSPINAETAALTISTPAKQNSGREVYMYHAAPKMKLWGLQCHNYTAATLGVVGAATASANSYYINATDGTTDSTTASSNQIDTTTAKKLFDGAIAGSLIDQVTIRDGGATATTYRADSGNATNADGEILFGNAAGSDVANSDLNWTMNHIIRVMDAVTDVTTTTETLTFTFTPEA